MVQEGGSLLTRIEAARIGLVCTLCLNWHFHAEGASDGNLVGSKAIIQKQLQKHTKTVDQTSSKFLKVAKGRKVILWTA